MSDRVLADQELREKRVRQVIEQRHDEYRPLADGQPADHIPELANVDPDAFPIVVTVAGHWPSCG
jgi:glutaminase